MSTLSELCRNVIDELGVAGGNLSFPGVASARGEFARIVRFVKQADQYINNLHLDWRWLWYDYSATMPAGSTSFPSAPVIAGRVPLPKQWMYDTVLLNRGQADYIKLSYLPWRDFAPTYRAGLMPTAPPSQFSIRPDNVLVLNSNTDRAYTANAEFYQRPFLMVQDTDEPMCPEDWHRIIEVRAKIFYAEREDAPEIMMGALSEYDDLLQKMEASELDGWSANTMGHAQTADILVDIP